MRESSISVFGNAAFSVFISQGDENKVAGVQFGMYRHGIRSCDNTFTIGKTTNNVRLGTIFDLNMYNSFMDELEIYSKVLTQEEIQKKYDKIV